ncbi:hypothetical protein JTE90_012505 [Oedothorax gibbosus]|uniref:Uncharacterized protein n=1 Tax=Oedothorax gibbosus TaxID=931172 RepID=A0AAV6V0Q5_9ARAC|nr:hypothetical protein JTE90_012505 [Oedothorax gibbosus]
MSNKGGANFEVVEDAIEVIEVFGRSQELQVSGSEQNAGVGSFQQNISPSVTASHPLQDILPNASLEQQELHRIPNTSTKRNPSKGEIPKDTEASDSDPNPDIKNPSDDPLAIWKDTGAIPKYLTQENASKYLPPFKKPQSRRPKPEMQPSSEVSSSQSPVEELCAEFKELQEDRQKPVELQHPVPATSEQEPELSKVQQEPAKERRSSQSEQAQFVRQHCLDFQDYKRTVNNRLKSLEQSLNQLLPKMNTAMVDAEKLAEKIEKVRNRQCETEEALKIQNDKMKYLVGRTVGTISKIDRLFERFRTDISEYTTLTTEGNAGIDGRLSKLLRILCGVEDKVQEQEEVATESSEQSDDS